MRFSSFTRFGFFRFSGAKPRPQVWFESLGTQVDVAFDTTGQNAAALEPLAEKFALAYHLARQEWALTKAGNQRNVNLVTDMLPCREADFMATPGALDTISARQQRLASIALLPGGATQSNIAAMLSTLLGSAFLKLRVVATSEVTTNLPISNFQPTTSVSKFLQLPVPMAQPSLSAVASAGSSPPTVTISANGLPASQTVTNLYIAILTGGGPVGTARFNWSINGGFSTAGANVLTAPSVILPGIGITVNFSAGTYTGTGAGQNLYTATITPQLIGYANLDLTIATPTLLSIGDVVTVQGESRAQGEVVTVSGLVTLPAPVYYGATPVTNFFQATFGNSHDTGATVTTMSFPRWTSSKAFLYVEVTPAAASNPIVRGQIDALMEKVARGFTGWATVAPSGGALGPFTLGASGLGTATVGGLVA